MTRDIGPFRRALEALVEGRSRQAKRYVDAYMADHKIAPSPKR